ncbi:hypothetical protein AB0C52_35840 [Streptomyces sp. NPDC048717]|uniref:hypothetical protein n=1 Tax=Streptomyces sp. NPDC048717 TaxID=3154928 RepID=UPI00341EF009
MSIRRPLGTGPTSSTTSTRTSSSPRLLPVERAEPGAVEHDQEHEHLDRPGRGGRRQLGTGPGTA